MWRGREGKGREGEGRLKGGLKGGKGKGFSGRVGGKVTESEGGGKARGRKGNRKYSFGLFESRK